MIFKSLSLLLSFYWLNLIESKSEGPLVKLPQGLVQGTYQKSYKNRTFSAFEGIPYGKPPIGNLRFEEPLPADGWNDTLVANEHYECLHYMPLPIIAGPRGFGNVFVLPYERRLPSLGDFPFQFPYNKPYGSTEDCLFVYVYVPRENIDANELLDVVVHIHGGAFLLGAPKYMAGPQFLMDQDVIVVSLNYRLGVLGFLSTEDEVVPGNNGLKDQSLALQWIKENIKYFGGNPSSITLTGVSAGGASVHFHYFSPLSKGLFHRGLSQSGTALNCWALTERPLANAQVLANNISCPTNSTKEMVQCLKLIDGQKLVNGIRSLFLYMDSIPLMVFGPVIEKNTNNPFLHEHPYTLLKEGNVYDVPWINSNVKDEGAFPVVFFMASKKIPELDAKWDKIMPYALELYNTVDNTLQKAVLSKIKEFYFKNKPLSDENVFSLIELFSDRMFFVDAEKSLRLHSQAVKSEVYYYLYSYVLQMPHYPPKMPTGAPHGDDSRLIFKMFGTPRKLTDGDEIMMELFTEFIAKFAKTGVPSFGTTEWTPVSPGKSEIDYLYIGGADSISGKSIEHLSPTEFWQSLPIMEVENAISGSPHVLNVNYFIQSVLMVVICMIIHIIK